MSITNFLSTSKAFLPTGGLLLLLLLNAYTLSAQIPDSVTVPISANNFIKIDTLKLPSDTLLTPKIAGSKTIKISPDALEEKVEYSAEDSMRLDAVNKVVYLYGNATVKYTSITLSAGHIVFDMENDIVEATFVKDSLGRKSEKPVFTEGSTEPITADRMRYNFVTKKGKVYNTTTTQAGGFITSQEAKLVSKQDSIFNSADVVYGKNAIYSTCEHEHKHYGLRSQKQKIITEKLVVVGPSNIEIMGIPTPLWLPFGFFPLAEGQSGGLIFPKDYEYSPQWGYGLRNVGWYFGLGEHMDLQLVGDIYTRGSFGVRAISSYKKRYQYGGNFQLGYSLRKEGDPVADGTTPKSAFTIKWTHNQDSKAHPYRTFRAGVNIETNNFQRDNFNDAQSVLNSSLSSNVNFTRTFPGKPYSFSASLGHSQNVNTHAITLNLPTFDFNVKKVFPFKNQNRVGGKEAWYEKIGFTYTAKVQNTITGKDTLLFQPDSLDFSYGATHSIPLNANFKLFKYINVSPFVNYTEQWYLKTLRKEFDPTIIATIDTIFDANDEPIDISRDTTFGTINDITENGFRSLRELTTGVSLNTQLFGMVNFKRGPIKAIRHIAKPSVSFNYTPDYTTNTWKYWDEVQIDTRYPDEYLQYTYFTGGLFGSASKGDVRAISYNLTNILEAKVLSPRDTVNRFQKIKLLSSFNFSGNYNFAADSLKMSVITASGATTILKKINVSFGFTLDPLAANTYSNSRIDEYEWQKNGRLARMTSARLNMNTRLTSTFFQELRGKKPPAKSASQRQSTSNGSFEEDNGSPFSFLQNLSINYSLAMSNKYFDGVDSSYLTTNNIRISGGTVNLSSKWKITIGGVGYDFVQKSFTYPDFQFYRNLHCWEMGMLWQPQRGTYSFYIRVKQPSQLDFLNVPYKKNNYDVLGGF